MNDRFERQRDLIPAERLANLTVSIVGVGAIGRQVALQLAAIGVPRIQLIDFDRVEATNITTQGYLANDLGQFKVEATRQAVRAIDPALVVQTIVDRFRARHVIGEVVFCCVDSISSRSAIWRSVQRHCPFWVDGRMLGEVIRVLAATDHESHKHYESTLFAQSESQSGSCTTRAVIYAASLAAALMVNQFSRWVRSLPLDMDSSVNLLASEWHVISRENQLIGLT